MTKNTVDGWFRGIVYKVNDRVEGVAEQVAEEGQEMLQGMIQDPARGTNRTWKRSYNGRKGGFHGRVADGQMLADIDEDVVRFGSDAVVASFGWIHHYQDYYGMQDVGFTHEYAKEEDGSDIVIKGMFIMRDAEDLMVKRASDLIKRSIRAI